jgi:Protein of unknown function (DUF3040)
MESFMINDREHRILEDLERQLAAEDPGFARRLACFEPWARWRRAWRLGVSAPVVLLVAVLAITAFALQVTALGGLFLVWALIGGLRRLASAKRVPPRTRLPG